MDERVKFIARFLEGEKVARLAVEFGISRKTADKIIERYEDVGLVGLPPSTPRQSGLMRECLALPIPSTTTASSSPPADASASRPARST